MNHSFLYYNYYLHVHSCMLIIIYSCMLIIIYSCMLIMYPYNNAHVHGYPCTYAQIPVYPCTPICSLIHTYFVHLCTLEAPCTFHVHAYPYTLIYTHTCNSCNIDTSDLPDMYAQSLRAAGPRAEGIQGLGHTYQANHECLCYN